MRMFTAMMYKGNTQKSVIFLYSSNEHLETKIKNRMSFTITPKKSKFLYILDQNFKCFSVKGIVKKMRR